MIFDFYEQEDLFRIAKCGWRSTLERWMKENHIPVVYDTQNRIMAHKDAVALAFGVGAGTTQTEDEPKMWLGEEENVA